MIVEKEIEKMKGGQWLPCQHVHQVDWCGWVRTEWRCHHVTYKKEEANDHKRYSFL